MQATNSKFIPLHIDTFFPFVRENKTLRISQNKRKLDFPSTLFLGPYPPTFEGKNPLVFALLF